MAKTFDTRYSIFDVGSWLVLIVALCLTWPTSASAQDSVSVTYVGNEGFLIEKGEHKVLIDALYRTGVPGYAVHAPDLRRQLERADPPFDGVDLVLATHYHADHFDPTAVGTHLINNREARFLSTEQAVGALEDEFSAWRHISQSVQVSHPAEGASEDFEFGAIGVKTLNLHHGRTRPVQNLGFVVDLDGWRFLHIGDTEVTPEDLTSLRLDTLDLDAFFVPYWFLAYSEWDGKITPAVGDVTLIPMHMPPADDPRGYLSDLGGQDGAIEKISTKYPSAVVFRSQMETKIL